MATRKSISHQKDVIDSSLQLSDSNVTAFRPVRIRARLPGERRRRSDLPPDVTGRRPATLPGFLVMLRYCSLIGKNVFKSRDCKRLLRGEQKEYMICRIVPCGIRDAGQ